LVLFFTYAVNEQTKEPPKVFELVAGEGDNYLADKAPALGTPDGPKVAMTAPTPPAPRPEPPAPTPPAPEPVPPAPVRAAPPPEPVVERAPAPTKPPPDAIRDFSKDVKRISTKREKRLVEKYRKEREAAERKAKEEELKNRRMTKEEFDRQNKSSARTSGAGGAPKVARIDAEGIAGGVIGGSTRNKTGGAGGKALTRDEGDALDLYFSLLKRRLHEALDKPPGLSDTLVAEVEFYLSADGSLSGARITSSSGSQEFDQAALEAIVHVRSIGPRPDHKGERVSIKFRMREEDE
jgi:colicin import membrane protein